MGLGDLSQVSCCWEGGSLIPHSSSSIGLNQLMSSGIHAMVPWWASPPLPPRAACLNRDFPSRPFPPGSASAKAKYDVASLRKQAAEPLSLVEVARVSTLHSSVLDYLVKLSNERYAVLASWPDFTTAVSVVDVNWLGEGGGLEREGWACISTCAGARWTDIWQSLATSAMQG